MNTLLIAGVGVVAGAGYLAYRHDRRKDAAEQQAELNERLRTNPQSVLMPLREEYVTRNGDLTRTATNEGAAATAAETKQANWSAQFWRGKEPKLGLMVIVGVLAALWAFLFLLQRSTDITVMQALGVVEPQLFGNLIAVVFAVLGIFIGGVLGLHHLFPNQWEPRRVLPRVMIVAALALIACVGIAKIADLAQYRSIDRFSAQVTTDQATLKQLHTKEQTPAVQVEVASAQQTLAQDQQRLDQAKAMDKTLTMAVLPLELALSSFPIIGLELLLVSGVGRTAKRHRKLEQRAKDEQAALPQQFRQQAATMIAEANPNMTVAEINALLASLDGRQGPAALGGNTVQDVPRLPIPGPTALPPVPPTDTPQAPAQAAPQPDGGQQPAQVRPTRPGRLGDVQVFGRGTPNAPANTNAEDAPVRQPNNEPDDPPTWAIA